MPIGRSPRNDPTEIVEVLKAGLPVLRRYGVGEVGDAFLDAQTRFREDSGISEILGGGAVVGDEVWDPQAGLRVVLGPLSLAQYREFLPVGSAYQPLKTLVRFFAGDELDFELQLILKHDEVPPCRLGEPEDQAPLLGWVSWSRAASAVDGRAIAEYSMSRDPAETILPL